MTLIAVRLRGIGGIILKCTLGFIWMLESSCDEIVSTSIAFRGDSGHDTGRENRLLEPVLKPFPRNGETLPPDGLAGRDWFGSNSLIIVKDVFLCNRCGWNLHGKTCWKLNNIHQNGGKNDIFTYLKSDPVLIVLVKIAGLTSRFGGLGVLV